MKSTRITVNPKLLSTINSALSNTFCLSDVDELKSGHGDSPLFEDPPDGWSEFETDLCDWLMRKQEESYKAILLALGQEVDVSHVQIKQSITASQANAENKILKDRIASALYKLEQAVRLDDGTTNLTASAIKTLKG